MQPSMPDFAPLCAGSTPGCCKAGHKCDPVYHGFILGKSQRDVICLGAHLEVEAVAVGDPGDRQVAVLGAVGRPRVTALGVTAARQVQRSDLGRVHRLQRNDRNV